MKSKYEILWALGLATSLAINAPGFAQTQIPSTLQSSPNRPNPSGAASNAPVSTAPTRSASDVVTPLAGDIQSPAYADTLQIGGIGSARGAITINGASGVLNQQINAGLIASGPNAMTFGSVYQFSDLAETANSDAHAEIGPGFLAQSSGWIAVNGTAGTGNQSANLAVMAFGTEGFALSDSTLGQAHASTIPMGENGAADAPPSRSVAIGQGAFKESSGVVQLTLVGGDRNVSANTFALLVAGNAKTQ